MQIGVITNPRSRKNKPRSRRQQELEALVGARGVVRETQSLDEIKPVLREFLRRGLAYWVSDGGDGTLHWMLNQGFEVLAEDEFSGGDYALPACVPTNGGTIDFVAKKAGIAGDATSILERLATGLHQGTPPDEVEVDTLAIRMTVVDEAGGREILERKGFAAAAGGLGQRFFSYYYAGPDPNALRIAEIIGKGAVSIGLGQWPLRLLPALPPAWRAYAEGLLRPTEARVLIDGRELPWTAHTGIHAGSIDVNLGGVVRLFPDAAAPGRLHFLVGQPTPPEVVRNVPNLILGRKLRCPRLYDGDGETMVVEARGEELLAPVVDGELYFDVERIEFSLGPTIRVARVPRPGDHGIMRLGWRH